MLREVKQYKLKEGESYLVINTNLSEIFIMKLISHSEYYENMIYKIIDVIHDNRGYLKKSVESKDSLSGSRSDKFYVGEYSKEDLVIEMI